nr:carotenoid biosynthesis protein [Acidimicrobiia bacterium]
MTPRLEHVVAPFTALAMVAYPLARRGGPARRLLTPVVVGGLAAITTGATRPWGHRRQAVAAGVVAVATGALERIGTSTGVPFGRYRYTGVLRPAIADV